MGLQAIQVGAESKAFRLSSKAGDFEVHVENLCSFVKRTGMDVDNVLLEGWEMSLEQGAGEAKVSDGGK